MGLHYFANLIQKIKEINPNIHLKAFTAVELEYMCRKAKVSYKEGLQMLKDAGQDSLPGGGAEMFNDDIRNKVSLYCDVSSQNVISAEDMNDIYEVPLKMYEEGLDEAVIKLLELEHSEINLSEWESINRIQKSIDQEINIGMTADVGTLQRLPKLVPEGVVRELAYTGRRMSAQRAYEVGLVNEVFETHEELVEGVINIGNEIASKSPLAIWGTKESVNYARDHSVADSLNFIATWQAGMFQPKDMAAAFEAQAKKEDPDFDDLPPMRKGLG